MDIKEKIKQVPDVPGVYLMKDRTGRIIYIGKAKSLKRRLQTYFSRSLDVKTQVMVSKIADMEYRLTPSQAQAQILEAALIKDEQPQYNIDLKDDKSFPWIRITDEEFPAVSIYRKKGTKEDNRSLYFGPYTNIKLLQQAIKIIRKIFGFRSCKKMPDTACLYYRLKLCPAPCIKKISAREYREIINQIGLFLASKYVELADKLTHKMKEAAKEKRFEEAARIRDQINALAAIRQDRNYAPGLDELGDLKKLLKLDRLPLRIEAFDISNITGKQACGAMISFFQGAPDKNNYRRFRIKTISTIDDYKMLSELIHRRYARAIEEKLPLPDLILIDGGRSHLLTADKELKKLGLKIPLVSIAKDKENIYTKDKIKPIKLSSDTPALNLMRRIRDEAHRFAHIYHHVLRRKKIIGR